MIISVGYRVKSHQGTKDILQHAGTVSHQQALKKASEEYEKFKKLNRDEISETEKHFMKQIEQTIQKLDPKKNNHD
ncbi:hypothetical protein [Chitinophaga sp. YR573]|uniref:hypothetical protein n=1 Tax=Chitinophaga sp. YR573 TaxID=1881040 RepID=UPI001C4327D1|nr:hypothetical protein [Chitinophaga sp. YR573]